MCIRSVKRSMVSGSVGPVLFPVCTLSTSTGWPQQLAMPHSSPVRAPSIPLSLSPSLPLSHSPSLPLPPFSSSLILPMWLSTSLLSASLLYVFLLGESGQEQLREIERGIYSI